MIHLLIANGHQAKMIYQVSVCILSHIIVSYHDSSEFLPDPHGHWSFRPIWPKSKSSGSLACCAAILRVAVVLDIAFSLRTFLFMDLCFINKLVTSNSIDPIMPLNMRKPSAWYSQQGCRGISTKTHFATGLLAMIWSGPLVGSTTRRIKTFGILSPHLRHEA